MANEGQHGANGKASPVLEVEGLLEGDDLAHAYYSNNFPSKSRG